MISQLFEEGVREADRSPAELAALVGERSPDVLILVDPSGRVRYANRSVERVFGFDPAEHLGEAIWDFVHPEDLVAAAGAMNESTRDAGYHHPTEFRIRDSRGDWIDGEVTATTFDEGAGQWLVLSVRPVRDRDEVIGRRHRIEALIRTASLECSVAQPEAVDGVVDRFLGDLASVVGAELVELAWEEGDRGLRLGARWPAGVPATEDRAGRVGRRVEPLWPLEETVPRLLGFTSDLTSLPQSDTRDRLVHHGARAVVEVPLSKRAPWGLLRLTLGRRWRNWDDANVDLVAVLCTTLMATLRRCRAEAHLQLQARTDPLTGLLNRAEVYRRFERLLRDRSEGLRRGDEGGIGVLYADLDHFKEVNDRFGHAAGDRLLVDVADALRASVRDVDLVARIGGDEFVVICPDLDEPAQLDRLVARIGRAVERIDAGGVPVRLSLGGAIAEPGLEADEVVRRADEAMYCDKRGHRADATR